MSEEIVASMKMRYEEGLRGEMPAAQERFAQFVRPFEGSSYVMGVTRNPDGTLHFHDVSTEPCLKDLTPVKVRQRLEAAKAALPPQKEVA